MGGLIEIQTIIDIPRLAFMHLMERIQALKENYPLLYQGPLYLVAEARADGVDVEPKNMINF